MPLALFVTQSRFRVDCEYRQNGSTTAQSLNNSGIVSKANLCYKKVWRDRGIEIGTGYG